MIVGIDEVGRGSWAGPLVAGAVILDRPIRGVKDSKLLDRVQREKLALRIHQRALAVGIGWTEAAVIDEFGLTKAIELAMRQALEQINLSYDEIIIDGHLNFLSDNPKARAVIKADDSVKCVSAASIVAKVARDNYMREMAAKYPDYGFESHVGYGTKLHRQRLESHGFCDLHRRSYKPIQALLQLAA